jgi:hypothetical protein
LKFFVKLVAAAAILGTLVPSGSFASPPTADDKPKLTIKSRRIKSLLPGLAAKGYGIRFDFTAMIEGEIVSEDAEEYYCLDEVWDWDDGTESVYEPDCDPYEDGADLKRTFYDSHYFPRGTYFVTLLLMRNGNIVLKGERQILIK